MGGNRPGADQHEGILRGGVIDEWVSQGRRLSVARWGPTATGGARPTQKFYFVPSTRALSNAALASV